MLRILLMAFLVSVNVLAEPNIVVSIKPIHSIVSNITQGVTTPKLLIQDNQSTHHFHLKPSQMLLLNQADLVVSVHPSIEESITKVLSNINHQNKLYMVEHSAPIHEEHEHHHEDYHIWLDIDAVEKFSTRLSDKLISMDANNRLTYQANLLTFNQKLSALRTQIKQQLAPYQKNPMLTYSNAFKHFIRANGLNKLMTVVNNHEQKPSIKNILEARKTIRSENVQCLISDTKVAPKQVDVVVENLDVKHKSVDIIGFNHTQGNQHYFTLMQNIANIFEQCLK